VDILKRDQSEEGVLTLTLNRPERKNSIDLTLADELLRALEAAAENSAVRAVVITGAGDTFSTGGDLAGDGVKRSALAVMRQITRPALALHRFGKPTLAKVNGTAAGAGWNLALGCDLVVASDQARFCQIFARRALSLDYGGSWLLPRLVGLHRAKELALLADWVSAEEAAKLGLVNRVVPAAELDAFVDDWARRLAAGPPIALALSKRMLTEASARSFEEAVDIEATSQAVNFASEDTREGLKAFFEKRAPKFEGR